MHSHHPFTSSTLSCISPAKHTRYLVKQQPSKDVTAFCFLFLQFHFQVSTSVTIQMSSVATCSWAEGPHVKEAALMYSTRAILLFRISLENLFQMYGFNQPDQLPVCLGHFPS